MNLISDKELKLQENHNIYNEIVIPRPEEYEIHQDNYSDIQLLEDIKSSAFSNLSEDCKNELLSLVDNNTTTNQENVLDNLFSIMVDILPGSDYSHLNSFNKLSYFKEKYQIDLRDYPIKSFSTSDISNKQAESLKDEQLEYLNRYLIWEYYRKSFENKGIDPYENFTPILIHKIKDTLKKALFKDVPLSSITVTLNKNFSFSNPDKAKSDNTLSEASLDNIIATVFVDNRLAFDLHPLFDYKYALELNGQLDKSFMAFDFPLIITASKKDNTYTASSNYLNSKGQLSPINMHTYNFVYAGSIGGIANPTKVNDLVGVKINFNENRSFLSDFISLESNWDKFCWQSSFYQDQLKFSNLELIRNKEEVFKDINVYKEITSRKYTESDLQRRFEIANSEKKSRVYNKFNNCSKEYSSIANQIAVNGFSSELLTNIYAIGNEIKNIAPSNLESYFNDPNVKANCLNILQQVNRESYYVLNHYNLLNKLNEVANGNININFNYKDYLYDKSKSNPLIEGLKTLYPKNNHSVEKLLYPLEYLDKLINKFKDGNSVNEKTNLEYSLMVNNCNKLKQIYTIGMVKHIKEGLHLQNCFIKADIASTINTLMDHYRSTLMINSDNNNKYKRLDTICECFKSHLFTFNDFKLDKNEHKLSYARVKGLGNIDSCFITTSAYVKPLNCSFEELINVVSHISALTIGYYDSKNFNRVDSVDFLKACDKLYDSFGLNLLLEQDNKKSKVEKLTEQKELLKEQQKHANLYKELFSKAIGNNINYFAFINNNSTGFIVNKNESSNEEYCSINPTRKNLIFYKTGENINSCLVVPFYSIKEHNFGELQALQAIVGADQLLSIDNQKKPNNKMFLGQVQDVCHFIINRNRQIENNNIKDNFQLSNEYEYLKAKNNVIYFVTEGYATGNSAGQFLNNTIDNKTVIPVVAGSKNSLLSFCNNITEVYTLHNKKAPLIILSQDADVDINGQTKDVVYSDLSNVKLTSCLTYTTYEISNKVENDINFNNMNGISTHHKKLKMSLNGMKDWNDIYIALGNAYIGNLSYIEPRFEDKYVDKEKVNNPLYNNIYGFYYNLKERNISEEDISVQLKNHTLQYMNNMKKEINSYINQLSTDLGKYKQETKNKNNDIQR